MKKDEKRNRPGSQPAPNSRPLPAPPPESLDLSGSNFHTPSQLQPRGHFPRSQGLCRRRPSPCRAFPLGPLASAPKRSRIVASRKQNPEPALRKVCSAGFILSERL